MLALYRDALWLRRKLRGCTNDLSWLDLDGRTGLADGAEGAEAASSPIAAITAGRA